jgi:hypothetical protein
VAFVRLSSNKSSAKAFPKVSITLLYYRYSIICQASTAYWIKPVLLTPCENAGFRAWLRISTRHYLQFIAMETAMPQFYPQRHQLKHTRMQDQVRNRNERAQAQHRDGDEAVGACHSHAIAPTYG